VVDKLLANLVGISDNLLIVKPQLDALNSQSSTRGAECQNEEDRSRMARR
jgi:hypothetical protein